MGLKLHDRRHLPEVIARPLTSAKVLLATLLTGLMRVGLVGAMLCQVLLFVAGRHNCDVLAPGTVVLIGDSSASPHDFWHMCKQRRE